MIAKTHSSVIFSPDPNDLYENPFSILNRLIERGNRDIGSKRRDCRQLEQILRDEDRHNFHCAYLRALGAPLPEQGHVPLNLEALIARISENGLGGDVSGIDPVEIGKLYRNPEALEKARSQVLNSKSEYWARWSPPEGPTSTPSRNTIHWYVDHSRWIAAAAAAAALLIAFVAPRLLESSLYGVVPSGTGPSMVAAMSPVVSNDPYDVVFKTAYPKFASAYVDRLLDNADAVINRVFRDQGSSGAAQSQTEKHPEDDNTGKALRGSSDAAQSQTEKHPEDENARRALRDVRYHGNLGLIEFQKGKIEEAVNHYASAMKAIEPFRDEPWAKRRVGSLAVNLAAIDIEKNEPEDAKRRLLEARECFTSSMLDYNLFLVASMQEDVRSCGKWWKELHRHEFRPKEWATIREMLVGNDFRFALYAVSQIVSGNIECNEADREWFATQLNKRERTVTSL